MDDVTTARVMNGHGHGNRLPSWPADKIYFDSGGSKEGSPAAISRTLSPRHLLSQAEALVVVARQHGTLPLRSPTPDSSTPLFGQGEVLEPTTPTRASPSIVPSPPSVRELEGALKLPRSGKRSRSASLTASDSDERSDRPQSLSTGAGSEASAQQSVDCPDDSELTVRQNGRQKTALQQPSSASQARDQKAVRQAVGREPNAVRRNVPCDQTATASNTHKASASSRAQIASSSSADCRRGDRGQPGAPGRPLSHKPGRLPQSMQQLGRRPVQQTVRQTVQRPSPPNSKTSTSSSTSCSTS